MEITSSVVLPVTPIQMTAFSTWIKNTYTTYDAYVGALKSPAMDTYIKENILPIEMKTALRRSEPFIGEKYGDVNIQRLLLDRRRVVAKMKNLKGKVGTMTFPIESAQTRMVNRVATTERREVRIANVLREQQMRADYDAAYAAAYEEWNPFVFTPPPTPVFAPAPPKIVKILLTPEEGEVCMEGDCGICLVNHKLTDVCVLNCGHQFGSKCMEKWTKIGNSGTANTCPLCRTLVAEITEFIV